MKRSWLGFALLVVLLVVSLLASLAMVQLHTQAADKLEQAARFALEGNWASAAFLTADVKRAWEQSILLRCALADHGPMEDMDAIFDVLEVYGTCRETIAFAATCRELSQRMEAMGDAHRLKWQNLL